MLENALPPSSSSTEPLLFTDSDEEKNETFHQKNKSYKYEKSKISILSVMWRQKRIYLIKIFKLLILAVILYWIYFTYQNFIKSYYFIRDYDSSSSSSSYDGIYGPIPNYMELGDDVKYGDDEILKFKMEFKDLNINYHFLRDEKLECNETKLLIVIPSRPNAYHTRVAIRNSWLKNVSSVVTYRFIIGSTPNLTIQQLNHEEFEQYNDLIISNILDSYLNLTLKTNAILQWQQHFCPKIEYLLKTDDDTVVDVKRLLYWIENDYKNITKNFDDKVIFGKVWSKTVPKRKPNQKWYTSYQAWNRKFFPDYCNGPTYFMTAKAAEAILKQTSNFYLITIEDVFFTGILAEAAGIKRIDRWKNFGKGKSINSTEAGCDERNEPYLTSIYEIGNDKLIFEEGKSNEFSEATEKLLALTCSK